MSLDLAARGSVAIHEEVPPTPVTELAGELGGIDEVGRKDRLQHPVDLMLPRGFGQELLDLVEGDVVLPERAEVEVAGELSHSGSGYVLGEIAPVCHPDHGIAAAVNDLAVPDSISSVGSHGDSPTTVALLSVPAPTVRIWKS